MQKSLFSSTELQVIQQAKLLNVLVIGDSCTDRFVYGTCNRLSPEAPVPVLNHTKTCEMPGMAGNVAQNAMAFSKNVRLITQEGQVVKTRYVDAKSNQHIMRFDTNLQVDRLEDIFIPGETQELNNEFTKNYDVIILSDYNKGFLQKKHICRFTEKLHSKIYVDSKKPDVSCFKNSIIKLNQKEYEIASSTVDISSSIIETLGGKGAKYQNKFYAANTVEVFDVSGAGDTFLVAFSIFHVITKDIEKSITFANKCASIAVQKKGTYALKREDIK